jgi:hypothetical protein
MHLVASILLFASTVVADFYDGNGLKLGLDTFNNPDALSSRELMQGTGAVGYVAGLADAFDSVGHCLPSGVTKGQLADVVLQHLNRVPELRHHAASALVRAALARAFPCKP